jgi:hypothetical protein
LPHFFLASLYGGREVTSVGEIYNIHFTKILPSQTSDTERLKTQRKERPDDASNKV